FALPSTVQTLGMRRDTPPNLAPRTEPPPTPLCLKTASVPTSGKDFRAPKVEKELLSELRGAVLDETHLPVSVLDKHSLLTCLFPCTTIFSTFPTILSLGESIYDTLLEHVSSSQATPMFDDSSPQADARKTSLFDMAHSCWNPRFIPSVLRESAPRAPRARRVTISEEDGRRTAGTFIPLAGAEEEQVAGWFNRIMAAIAAKLGCAHSCRWSSVSSTSAISGGNMAIKPDLALCDAMTLRVNQLGGREPYEWKDIRVLCEHTSRPFNAIVERTIKNKAYTTFSSQPERRFVIILSITDRCLRLHLFDRSGAIYSRPYNIHQHPHVLIRLMSLFLTAPKDALGYDPTVIFGSLIPICARPKMPPSARADRLTITLPPTRLVKPTVRVGSRVLAVIRKVFSSDVIRGRATACWH
ncbi:hypothetical protein BV22DRAFT_1052819, partial [Leucogyrophana mollusca]